MKKTISLFSLMMLLATNFMPLVSFANNASVVDESEVSGEVDMPETISVDSQEVNESIDTQSVSTVLAPTDSIEGKSEDIPTKKAPVSDELVDGSVDAPSQDNVTPPEHEDTITNGGEIVEVPSDNDSQNIPLTINVLNATTEKQASVYSEGGDSVDLTNGGCFEVGKNNEIWRINIDNSNCFENREMTIPEGVKKINDWVWPYLDEKEVGEDKANERKNLISEIKNTITKVNLPDSLDYIGAGVFQGAENLSEINFPKSLTGIGEYAFQGTAITKADIHNVVDIPKGAFQNTPNLSEVIFSQNLKTIRDNAFQNCNAEMEISSENIISVGGWAFAGSNLKSIKLGQITSISEGTFAGSKLQTVTLNENLTSIGNQAFKGTSVGDIELKNVEYIGQQAFEGSKIGNLKITGTDDSKIELMAFKGSEINSVILSGINEIGQQSFSETQIGKIEITGNGNSKIALMAFSKAQMNGDDAYIHISNVKEIGQQSFEVKGWINEVKINGIEGGTSIDSQAFKNIYTYNMLLTDINKINQQAFESNHIYGWLSVQGTGDNSIIVQQSFARSEIGHIIVENVGSIGEDAFLNVSNVEEIKVAGYSVQTAISNRAFSNAVFSGGENVQGNIELRNISMVGEQAFGNVKNVKSLKVDGDRYFPPTSIAARAFTTISFTGDNGIVELNNVESIGEQGFFNAKNISSVTIAGSNDGLTVEARAFQNANLETLEASNVKELKHQAFFNVSGLESVTLNGSDNGGIIGDQAFENTPSTHIDGKEVTINIGDKITYIGKGAFQDSKATNINIEGATGNDSCKSDSSKNCGTVVEERALQGTTALKSATFGTGVTAIGSHQFVGSKVETIVIEGSEEYGTTIGNNAFQATQGGTVTSITLGEGVTTLGEYAFMNTKITEITIPSTVRVIPENSFVGVKTLTGVHISEGVEVIGKGAFIGTSLENVYIGGSENGTEIQENAFLNIKSLKTLTVEGGVSYIGKQAFQGTSITEVDIEGSKNGCRIDNGAFRNVDSITSIHLGTGVSYIEKQAFEGLDNVKSIKIDGTEEGTVIGEQAFQHARNLQTVELGSISRIDTQAFNNAQNLTTVSINGNDEGTIIGDQAFLGNGMTSLNLGNIKEIGNAAFAKTVNTNQTTYDAILSTLPGMGDNAFGYGDSVNVVIEPDLSTLTDAQIAELNGKNINIVQGYRINFMNDGEIYYSALFAKGSDYVLPYTPYKTGYELEGWTENGVDSIFHFDGNKINSNKTFDAKWKSIQEKVAETQKNESVVFLNHTNVTIYGEAENVNMGNSSNDIQLKSNNDVNQSAIFVDTEGNNTIHEELKVDTSKTVEYQGGVEIFFEVKKDNETKVVNETAKFSVPIAVKVPVSNESTEYVKVKVKHEGDEGYGYKGLTLNPKNHCEMGEAIDDKYDGESIVVVNNAGDRYATIYTCSASTFVAYTDADIVVPVVEETKVQNSSSGGGRKIVSTPTTEQEHNSADIVTSLDTTKSNTTTGQQSLSIDEEIKKIENVKLTRGEVAVMTNILLNVFPQLTEGKQELDDVTNACSNYADEQRFTKDEKKAITRLCKLSIMGVHADTKEPLDEFMVKERTKNNEFATVINRSISTYNEKDLSVVKDALKKLENNEDNVVFGTLFNVFMTVKDVLNK